MPGCRLSAVVQRAVDLRQSGGVARGRAPHTARSPANRDRQPLSIASPAARQAQRASECAAGRGAAGGAARDGAGGDGGGGVGERERSVWIARRSFARRRKSLKD